MARQAHEREVKLNGKDQYGVDTPHGTMWAASQKKLIAMYQWVFGRKLIITRLTLVP